MAHISTIILITLSSILTAALAAMYYFPVIQWDSLTVEWLMNFSESDFTRSRISIFINQLAYQNPIFRCGPYFLGLLFGYYMRGLDDVKITKLGKVNTSWLIGRTLLRIVISFLGSANRMFDCSNHHDGFSDLLAIPNSFDTNF